MDSRGARPAGALRGPTLALLVSVLLHGMAALAWREQASVGTPPTVLQVHWLRVSPTVPEPAPEPPRESPPQVVSSAIRSSPGARRLAAQRAPAERSVVAPLAAAPAPAPAPELAQAASAPVGLPPAPDYLPVATLSPRPEPLNDISPHYPDTADRQQGRVVLRLLINEAGTVDNVGVVQAFPPQLFEQEAIAAFSKAVFSPGMLAGKPVKSQWVVEVEFTPFNRGGVSGQSY